MSVFIRIKRLAHGKGLELPSYESADASGMDLRAAVENIMTLAAHARVLVPTGFSVALPSGFEAQVRPRSGLALKSGITCLNTPGTIDRDYRGEIGVILINHSTDPFQISRGDRIAQLVIVPVARGVWEEVDELPETVRNEGGFGSSGIR